MPSDLERRLRAARPALAEPDAEATARARMAVLERRPARGVRPGRWAGGRATRLLILAGLLAVCGGAVAATLLRSGTAAPPPPPTRWQPAQTISARFSGFTTPAAAASAQGDVLVAWSRDGRLEARVRRAGGAWGPVAPLSAAGAVATAPAAAMDGRGGALVVWRERKGGRRVVLPLRLPSGAPAAVLRAAVDQRVVVVARERAAGGGWGPLVTLSAPSTNRGNAAEPQLAIARDGSAVAAWPYGRSIQVRTRDALGRWGAVQSVDAGGAPSNLRLALDPSGAAALVWSSRHERSLAAGPPATRVSVVRVALRAAGGAWQSPADVSEPLKFVIPDARIAVDAHLRAVAVWSRTLPPAPRSGIVANAEVAVHAPGGGWSAPRPVDPHPPAVAPLMGVDNRGVPGIDADGTVVVLVSRGRRLAFTTLAPAGDWSPLRYLSGGPAAWSLLAPDGDGLTAVLGTLRGLVLRRWRPGAGWGPPLIASSTDRFGVEAAFAASARGSAVIAWFHVLSGTVRAAIREPVMASQQAPAAAKDRP